MSFTISFSQIGVQKYKSSLDIQTIKANNCKILSSNIFYIHSQINARHRNLYNFELSAKITNLSGKKYFIIFVWSLFLIFDAK